MFKNREVNGSWHQIEKVRNGFYEVRIRAGVTLIAKHLFDSGREAHRAYRLSAETFINRYC